MGIYASDDAFVERVGCCMFAWSKSRVSDHFVKQGQSSESPGKACLSFCLFATPNFAILTKPSMH